MTARGRRLHLDGLHLHPEAGVVALVLLVALDLLLDPLDGALVACCVLVEPHSPGPGSDGGTLTSDIGGVGVLQAGRAVTVAATPSAEAKEGLAVVARLDVLLQVLAAAGQQCVTRCQGLTNLLQDGTVVDLLGGLALELGRGLAQHHPVLLEDAEVGRIAGLAVAWGGGTVSRMNIHVPVCNSAHHQGSVKYRI